MSQFPDRLAQHNFSCVASGPHVASAFLDDPLRPIARPAIAKRLDRACRETPQRRRFDPPPPCNTLSTETGARLHGACYGRLSHLTLDSEQCERTSVQYKRQSHCPNPGAAAHTSRRLRRTRVGPRIAEPRANSLPRPCQRLNFHLLPRNNVLWSSRMGCQPSLQFFLLGLA